MEHHVTLILGLSVLLGVAFAALGILHSRRGTVDFESFISYRNSSGLGVAVASIVASIAGAWILFSPAETGSWAGISGVVGYGVGQGMPILVLVVFGARLRKIMPRGYSFSGFIEKRYGALMGRFTALLMIFYMFTFLTAELTGIAEAFLLITKVPLLVTAFGVMVLTLIYTAYGGLRSSIFTDFLQFVLIVPLLIVIFVAALLYLNGVGGWDGTGAEAAVLGEASSRLWNPVFRPGVEFALSLVIAVTAANIFHQGFWQRVYSCRTTSVMRRAFLIAGLITIPVIVLMGLFGIFAAERGWVAEGQASTALFALLLRLPPWVVVLALVFGLVLVMSSADTLINGIVSILVTWRGTGSASDAAEGTAGARSAAPDDAAAAAAPEATSTARLGGGALGRARVLTVVIAALAVVIASRGYSVLYIFLVADLVCSAAVFPALYGLYATRLTGAGALIASAAGLAAGALFFPAPDFTSWSGLPANTLYAFAAALLVAAVLSILFNHVFRLGTGADMDFRPQA